MKVKDTSQFIGDISHPLARCLNCSTREKPSTMAERV